MQGNQHSQDPENIHKTAENSETRWKLPEKSRLKTERNRDVL